MNPKQGLTRLDDVVRIASADRRPRGTADRTARAGRGASDELRAFASSLDLGTVDQGTVAELRQDFSISTIEELAALAATFEGGAKEVAQRLHVPERLIATATAALEQTEEGRAELEDWRKYEMFEYDLGFEFDPDEEPPSPEPGEMGAAMAAAPLPPSVNLIDAHMSPIRDQAQRGTCVAFTAMSCLEYYQNRFCQQSGIDLSEQFAFWNMVSQTGHRNLVSCYPLLKSDGACRELTWPYNPRPAAAPDDQGPAPHRALREAPAYRCRDVLRLAARVVDDIKEQIAQHRVVGIGIPVYSSWMNSPVVRKYGNITVPLPGEVAQRIGHAVALVGYEDNGDFAGGGYFIVRNSWNGFWATHSTFGPGYGTIPYRYIEKHNWDAWSIRA